MNKPTILITPGDPAGIGFDLILETANHAFGANLVIIADPRYIVKRAEERDIDISIHDVENLSDSLELPDAQDTISVLPVINPNYEEVSAGKPNASYGNYLLETLSTAIHHCQNNNAAAMVTGPLNKALINEAGHLFSGHTEFLAENTDTSQTVMMLANDDFRMCLATTHVPLKDVAKHITKEKLNTILQIIHHDLQTKFKIDNPTIAVLGLNPHAGENGYIGTEEVDYINPLLDELRENGMNLIGPLSADTAFCSPIKENADAYLAMYHDQGLPIVKYTGFGKTVNITLGLPIIRTSVDHGTAYELAATDKINTGSYIQAVNQAIQFTQ